MRKASCHLVVLISLFTVSSSKLFAEDRAHQLASQANEAQPVACASVSDSKACHSKYPDGCTVVRGNGSPRYDAYLDFLKNQVPTNSDTAIGSLTEADIVSREKQTSHQMTQFNHAQFASDLAGLGEGNIYTVVGYLYYHEHGGKETCNCKLTEVPNIDFHIGLGFDQQMAQKIADGSVQATSTTGEPSTEAERTSMIVEMTPHYRAQFHPKWSDELLDAAVGKQIKVTGQLLADNGHLSPKEDCGFSGANTTSCWRMAVWELHPVVDVYVCKKGVGCGNDTSEWEELDNVPNKATSKPAHRAKARE